jgi:hypothetical protein
MQSMPRANCEISFHAALMRSKAQGATGVGAVAGKESTRGKVAFAIQEA